MSWNTLSNLKTAYSNDLFDFTYNSSHYGFSNTWSQNYNKNLNQQNYFPEHKKVSYTKFDENQDKFQQLLKKIQKVKHQYEEDHNKEKILYRSLEQKLEFKKKKNVDNEDQSVNKHLRRAKTYQNLKFDQFDDKMPLKSIKTNEKNCYKTQFNSIQPLSFNMNKKLQTPSNKKTQQVSFISNSNKQNLFHFSQTTKQTFKTAFKKQDKQDLTWQNYNQSKIVPQQKKEIHYDLDILNKVPMRHSINLDIQEANIIRNLQTYQNYNFNTNQDIFNANFRLNFTQLKQQLKISDFQLGNCIGSGKFGQVYLCKHKRTNFICALKKILKSTIQQYNMVDQFIRELKISYMVNHPNVIKTYGHFHDQFHVFLLMEYAGDGCVIDNLKFKKCQSYSSKVLFQTLNAIDHLHRNKIVHRDIKPENIVVFFKDTFKICDFGLSAFVDNQMKTTFCGTADYLSPQMKDIGQYDTSVDLWSLGVLAFELIQGQPPFKQKITQWKKSGWKKSNYWTWKVEYPKQFSEKSISFMKGLLKQKPEQRQKIINCLRHQFIVSYNKDQMSCIKSAHQTIFM